MKSYLEVAISSSGLQRELLIPTMIELGCTGFQETDNDLLCYFEKTKWDNGTMEFLKSDLKRLLQSISVNVALQFREFDEENWNEQWEKSLSPIEIGYKLVIKPSWRDYDNHSNRIIINIDPKMSFGTGYHETTRLTLRLLEKYLQPKDNMLDIGTGTGILAIAAAKLGASASIGTDIDNWSIENANENVLANGVERSVIIVQKSLSEFAPMSFDLITANLTLNTNIELLFDFKSILTRNGKLLLSGLLEQDQYIMIQKLKASSFELTEVISENEWVAIAAHQRE